MELAQYDLPLFIHGQKLLFVTILEKKVQKIEFF